MNALDREDRFAPGKLWSLWDMIELKLKPLMIASEALSLASGSLKRKDVFVDESYVNFLRGQIEKIREEMINIQMGGVSVFMALGRLEQSIRIGAHTKTVDDYITEFKKIFIDELTGTFALTLSYSEKHLYQQANPLFGDEVATKFSSLTYEIDEVGKCLALGRSTAAAFHMLRCLEGAMRAIARCLGIPDPIKGKDRNWSFALKDISDENERRWPKASRVSGDGVLFERYHGTLMAMSNPYRNATMHLEEKYTEAEARSLLEIVRSYLQSVAKRMDEDGNPKA